MHTITRARRHLIVAAYTTHPIWIYTGLGALTVASTAVIVTMWS